MGFALIEKHDILFLHCTDVRRAAMAGTERYVRNSTADFFVFTKDSETDGIEVRVQDHEVWLTQKGIGQLFDVDRSVVAKHLRNIFAENELSESTTCAKFAQVADNGKTYQVGEFSTDNKENTSDCIYVKLLKGITMSPDMMFWDLMMKNVYSLGAYSVQKEKFKLNVTYQSDSTGTYVNYLSRR